MALAPLPQTWDLKAMSGRKTPRLFSLQFLAEALKAEASSPASF